MIVSLFLEGLLRHLEKCREKLGKRTESWELLFLDRKGICLRICLAFLQKDSAGSCTGNSGLRAGAACVDTGQVVCVANEIFWSKYMLRVDITCVPFVSSF